MADASALGARANSGDFLEESVVFIDLTGRATICVGDVQVDGVFRRVSGDGTQKAV